MGVGPTPAPFHLPGELAAGPGTDLMLRASGNEAVAALDALAELIDRRFDED